MPYTICQVGLVFPWLEIKKNEAYAVFTHGACNEVPPWINAPVDFYGAGNLNAYFRWKSVEDTPTSFKMQLWIAHPKNPRPHRRRRPARRPVGRHAQQPPPADVTPRRLQQFKVTPGTTYAWTVSQDGKVLASGDVTPDLANLLTIPKVPLTLAPVELTLTAK